MRFTRKSGFTLVLVVAIMITVEGFRSSLREGVPAVETVPVFAADTPEAAAPVASPPVLEELPMEGMLPMDSTSPEPVSTFTSEDAANLAAEGWDARVGEGPGIWICVERQRCYLIEGGEPQMDLVCATAEAGTGSIENSMQTPLGWHVVATKIGADAPWGQVFRSRGASNETWKPGTHAGEDLVLTRILWLAGLEPGKNLGTDAAGHRVDSEARFIYIHGTNEEERLGTPSSHGCIRVRNDDVIALFDRVPEGTPVLITERV